MSLRVFHIVFITASIILSALAGVWGVLQFATAGNRGDLGVGIAFLTCGIALMVYAVRAYGKLRELV